MDKTQPMFAFLDSEADFCSICRIKSGVNISIDEVIELAGSRKALSLYEMLEMLFPSAVNNLEELGEKLTWLTQICDVCKQKVIEAYELYEQCKESSNWFRNAHSNKQNSDGDAIKCEFISVSPVPFEELIECKDEYQDPVIESMDCSLDEDSKEVIFKVDRISEYPPTIQRTSRRSSRMRKTKRQSFASEDTAVETIGNRDGKNYSLKKNDEHKQDTQADELTKDKMISKTISKNAMDQLHTRRNKKRPKNQRRNEKAESKYPDKDCLDETPEHPEELQTIADVYLCQLCEGPTYESPAELTKHLNDAHPDQILACDKCPKVFMSEQTFQHHQYCHATGRSYFCNFCDKGFLSEHLRKSHIRSHTHGAEFLCSLCGKKFNNKSNLRQHLMRHTGAKPWACSECPSRFCTKGALKLHQRTHSELRAFSCDTCGSQFHTRYSLVKHKLIHTGERPYACDVCPMRFVSTYHVKRHKLTHTGEKPFKCSYCERSFAQSNDMVKHMKLHVGDNPYQCDRCESSFRLLAELRNHYKEHYQSGENSTKNDSSWPAEEDKNIRFTSTDILKLRFEKEMSQYNGRCEESGAKRRVFVETTKFPEML